MVLMTSFPPPTDGIAHCENDTLAVVGNQEIGQGKLFIAKSCVSWLGNDQRGFSIEYPAISIHAVCRDRTKFPNDCLYLLLDGKLPEAPAINGHTEMDHTGEEESDAEDDDVAITELRFVPANSSSLDTMFKSMSECQILHPDQAVNEDLDDDEGVCDEDYDENDDTDASGEPAYSHLDPSSEYFTDETGFEHLTAAGRANLTRFEAMLSTQNQDTNEGHDNTPGGLNSPKEGEEPMETGQFDDAD